MRQPSRAADDGHVRAQRNGAPVTGRARTGRRVASQAAGWLRAGRGGLFLLALLVGAGSGLGAVVFRYLIYFFTWLATGHSQFGQQGHAGSAHLPWLGLGFFVVIPAIGGLIYGPLIYRFAREARGHGVPEVMIAVAEDGGRIRPQVSVVKAVASAVCIGVGGSVGREGPIVQIGSALASGLGQWVKMPEDRLRILVACGAAGGIAATFNAPITGVFFGVEIILREFSIDALFTVMLAAMIADITAIPFLGGKPFLSGFPPGIELHHARNYLLVALLAVVAALIGLAFKTVLYKTEDLCDRAWQGRPEWARPAVGGVALGLLLLAVPQMYGVGYPVMYKATAGQYALWFLILLAFAKIAACSLTIGIGGSGGVFAPSLFIGVTSGMAYGDDRAPPLRAGRGPARPVRGGGDGRGVRLRRPRPAHLPGQRGRDDRRLRPDAAGHARRRHRLADLPRAVLRHHLHHQAAAPRHRHRPHHPLARPGRPQDRRRHAPVPPPAPGPAPRPAGSASDGGGAPRRTGPGARAGHLPGRPAGPVRHRVPRPGAAAAGGLRPRRPARPVRRRPARYRAGSLPPTYCAPSPARSPPPRPRPARPRPPPSGSHAGPGSLPQHPPTPLPGYQFSEITITAGSPAAGRTLADLTWPPGSTPVISPARPPASPAPAGLTLAPGDRVGLLTAAPGGSPERDPAGHSAIRPGSDRSSNHGCRPQ